MEKGTDRSNWVSATDALLKMKKSSSYCTKGRFLFLLLMTFYGFVYDGIVTNTQLYNEIFVQQNVYSGNQTITVNSKMDGELNISLKPIYDSFFQESNQSVPKFPKDLPLPSLLRGDVESITHFPKEAKIVVSFKSNHDRKCKRPRIFGRISGKYITMINWDHDKYLPSMTSKHEANSSKWRNIITGYYQVPAPGHYFLEIIGILCNDLTYEGDLDSSCLEDPADHRLTNDGAFIDVPNAIIDSTDVHAGYWRWSHRSEPYPLYTRHQCRPDPSRNALQQLACNESETLERFKPYKFEWSGGYNFSLPKPKASNYTFCVVGTSHARTLGNGFQHWIDVKRWKNVRVEHIFIERPSHMTDETAKLVINGGCSISIVAVGQWSSAGAITINDKASFGHGATKFQAYQKDLNAGIQKWKEKGINFILRNIHYNGLGWWKTGCPSLDHRIPPIIDGYNEIVQRLAENNNIPYINSKSLTDPVWDSAFDYSHYTNINRKEAFYFLKRMFD